MFDLERLNELELFLAEGPAAPRASGASSSPRASTPTWPRGGRPATSSAGSTASPTRSATSSTRSPRARTHPQLRRRAAGAARARRGRAVLRQPHVGARPDHWRRPRYPAGPRRAAGLAWWCGWWWRRSRRGSSCSRRGPPPARRSPSPAGSWSRCCEGLTLAGLLFVVASGFTLIFGLMRTVNMAHGSLFLLAGFTAISIQQSMVGKTRNIAPDDVSLLRGSCRCSPRPGSRRWSASRMQQVFLRWNQGQELRQALITLAISVVLADQMLRQFGGLAKTMVWPGGGLALHRDLRPALSPPAACSCSAWPWSSVCSCGCG